MCYFDKTTQTMTSKTVIKIFFFQSIAFTLQTQITSLTVNQKPKQKVYKFKIHTWFTLKVFMINEMRKERNNNILLKSATDYNSPEAHEMRKNHVLTHIDWTKATNEQMKYVVFSLHSFWQYCV